MRPAGDHWRPIAAANPPLSVPDQIAFARRAKAGDVRARDRLVLSMLGFCFRQAHRLEWAGVPFDDLVQYGIEGVLKALKTYQPGRGVAFGTHCVYWIKAVTMRACGFYEPLVKLPIARRKRGEIVADNHDSLDQPVTPTSDATRAEIIGCKRERQDRLFERAALAVDVQLRCVDETHPIDREILAERLSADEPMTFREIAARHGLSRERIRQREKALKARLAKKLADVEAEAA